MLSLRKLSRVFGGILGTISVSIIVNYYWTVLPYYRGFIGIRCEYHAPMGDLLASAIKGAKVKDSGMFLPGHGGALDRLDSFITAAPLAIIIYQYLS